MGREVKRVPLDFDWPLHKIWPGYERSDAQQHPPKGPGWQMWENTSEGSPISPVFKKPEKLATWLATTKASAMGGKGASRDEWLGMIREGGSAITGVVDRKTGDARSGVSLKGQNTSRTPVRQIADAFKARLQQLRPDKDIDRER